MKSFEDFAWVAMLVVWVISKLVAAARKQASDQWVEAPQQESPPIEFDDVYADGDDDGDDSDDPFGDAWPSDSSADVEPSSNLAAIFDELRRDLLLQIDAFRVRAETVSRSARVDRATTHIAQAIDDYVVQGAHDLYGRVQLGKGEFDGDEHPALDHLTGVLSMCDVLIAERQQPGLRTALGDADKLAYACYESVFEFARANRLELTSAYPVTLLTPFDLGIWTGFIPTGIAPIFLPPAFFSDIRWWPAIAHEIGHDFLAATKHADARIRTQLGVVSEKDGKRPITPAAFHRLEAEFYRIFGAWFEEMFCDVFGTMMMGAAYGYTMVELFSDARVPGTLATVSVDERGNYGVHPPRHLRVLWCAHALRLMAEDDAAAEIETEWAEIHGPLPEIVYPSVIGNIAVPTQAIFGMGAALVERLYSDGLHGLDGHSLRDIPGLEYGTHRAAEAHRARNEILSGRAPSDHKTRAVIAGAVLAWRKQPSRHEHIMTLARRAVVGVTETREDSYLDQHDASRSASGVDLREAFLLHTVLSPPPSLRAFRPNARGFLERPRWPR